MNVEELREYALSLPYAEESLPFDETTLVIKVKGKMFLLFDIESKPLSANVKCDPDKALELREKYFFVHPGYHMSKKHWNTVVITEDVPDELIQRWVRESYLLVVKGLKKEDREIVLRTYESEK
ncbi:MAG: MmcQ/YjbR family DNA-binding protein [Bacteroidales bacterium]